MYVNQFFGHNSDTLSRISTRLGGIFSYKSPAASAPAPAPGAQAKTMKK